MANYKICIKPSAAKELKKIPKKVLQKVVGKIKGLAFDPRPPGCEKLSSEERFRIRQGDYRIVYTIEDEKLIVIVVKIGYRRDDYKKK
ncbi:MAG: type II toxin-antitoxin system RelE/ParE family toxin [Bacteroidales bacterium]|nr:type II toxin-antitoxin system RelE/ParE family toxin [Bacteroidales bacterium]